MRGIISLQEQLRSIIDDTFKNLNPEAAKNYSEGLVDGVKLANYFDENLSYEEREWLLEYIIDKTNEKERENENKRDNSK